MMHVNKIESENKGSENLLFFSPMNAAVRSALAAATSIWLAPFGQEALSPTHWTRWSELELAVSSIWNDHSLAAKFVHK